MFTSIRIAYGAGIRAGKSEPTIVTRDNGLKYIARPHNPYRGRLQFIQRLAWDDGECKGTTQRLLDAQRKYRQFA